MSLTKKALSKVLAKANTQPTAAAADTQKGFSLPSVIVGSIIAAVLGGMALTSMWGSVDKAAVAAEVGSIAEIKTAAAGLREDANGYPTVLDSANDTKAVSRTAQLPKEFKYQLVLMTDGTNPYMAVKAVANGAEGRDRLNAVANSLDLRYDSTAGAAAGKFIYANACSDVADQAQNAVDCFYITPVMAKSVMTADVAGDTAADTATTAFNTALSTGVADYVTELN